jgi:phosphoenolpyruvate carboxykinase (ATP)
MFNEVKKDKIKSFIPEWNIINAPGFLADPKVDGTRKSNFSIIDFTKKIILIGGTGYTGEIKKGIFSLKLYFTTSKKYFIHALFCKSWKRWRYSNLFWFIWNRKNYSICRSR